MNRLDKGQRSFRDLTPYSVGIIMHTNDNHFVYFQKKIKDFILNEVVLLFDFNE